MREVGDLLNSENNALLLFLRGELGKLAIKQKSNVERDASERIEEELCA